MATSTPNSASSSSNSRLDGSSRRDVIVLSLVVVCFFGFYLGSLHWSYSVVDVVASSSANSGGNSIFDRLEELLLIDGPPPASKRRNNTSNNKIHKVQPQDLRLPTPVLVMGLDRAGTTAIHDYFQCGLVETAKLALYDCHTKRDETGGEECGHRLAQNIESSKPAFEGMDQFDVYAGLDTQTGDWVLPQHRYLQEIHDQFPEATWILNTPDSLDRKPLMPLLAESFKFPSRRTAGGGDQAMIRVQAQQVKELVSQHPSHHLVEVATHSFDAAQVMENAFGIPKECWGRTKPRSTNSVLRQDAGSVAVR